MSMRKSLPHWLLPIGALAFAVALGGCDDSPSSKGTGGSGAGGKGGSAAGGASASGGHAGSTGLGGSTNGGSTGKGGAAGASNGGSTGTAGSAGGSTGGGGKGGSAAGGSAAGGSAAGGSGAKGGAGGQGGTSGSAGGAGGASLAASLCPGTGGMYTDSSQTAMTASDFCTLFLQNCGTTTAGHATMAECMTTYTSTLTMAVRNGSNNGTIGACESYHMCNVINVGAGHCQHAAGAAICVAP